MIVAQLFRGHSFLEFSTKKVHHTTETNNLAATHLQGVHPALNIPYNLRHSSHIVIFIEIALDRFENVLIRNVEFHFISIFLFQI